MTKTIESDAIEAYKKGQELKKLHQAEIVETGTGPMPRSRLGCYPHLGWDKGEADQTGKEQADINFIMRRIEKAGTLADLIAQGMQASNGQMYGDFSDPVDFQEAMTLVAHATQQFDMLDAPIRNRFNNNPREFLEFMSDDKNMEEQAKMGLRARKPPEEPVTTLKDVVQAVKETRQAPKKPSKGDTSED